ncbi:SDR family oxidoreductase [Cytobacillus horneckiae]|uniref:SDR family oxidoreductase n=1 Tax=Cytobacillus horneckiae TaxID=549687 RepID=UPI003D9A8B98
MKVLVVGANGQIGKHVINKLKESNHFTPRAMVRKQEQFDYFNDLGVDTVLASLTGTVDEIAEAAKDCEAIVFTAGSGGHTGYDQTLLIDLDGAGKTIEAAQKAGVDRFIMVSAIHADKRESWTAIQPYMVAKHYADKMLVASGLNYTILRPGGLLNEEPTGKISIGSHIDRSTIPREDVASTILAVLENNNTINQSFDLVSGETPINDAITKI